MISEDISLDLWLLTKKISRSHFYLLRYYIEERQSELPKKCKFINELVKYGFVYNDQISASGLDLYSRVITWQEIYKPGERKVKEKRNYSQEFLEWLEKFPENDTFDEFMGVRDFHKNLDASERLYNNIIKDIPHTEMVIALTKEVQWRKTQSKSKGINQLSFLSNTHNYLKDKKFEKFLYKTSEISKENRVIINKTAY